MKEHEISDEMLALAAAGALEPDEMIRVQRHLSTCETCRQEFASLEALADDLRAMPQPQVPMGLARRTHTRVLLEQTAANETRWRHRMIAGTGVFAGVSSFAFVILFRILTGTASEALAWSAGSAVVTWATAGAAVIMLRSRRVWEGL